MKGKRKKLIRDCTQWNMSSFPTGVPKRWVKFLTLRISVSLANIFFLCPYLHTFLIVALVANGASYITFTLKEYE